MPAIDQLLTTIENYNHPNLLQYLQVRPVSIANIIMCTNRALIFMQFSGIARVMRHIAALPKEKIPCDDEFKFRTRATSMVDKWYAIVVASTRNAKAAEGAVNGVGAEKKADNN